MSKLLTFFACLVLFAASCSQDDTLAGTDTGNPTIQALVRDSNGTPLSLATVVLYRKIDSTTTIAVDTLRSDSKGLASFEAHDNGEYVLEASWNDSLGALGFAKVQATDTLIALTAGEMTPFTASTTGPTAILDETGRQIVPGSTTLVPPGLWKVRFASAQATDSLTLPALQIRMEDLRNTPEDLTAFSEAAQFIQKLSVNPGKYVGINSYPDNTLIVNKIAHACEESSKQKAPDCSEDKCRILTWDSNWRVIDSKLAVKVSVITGQGRAFCAIFTERDSTLSYFFNLDEVEPNND